MGCLKFIVKVIIVVLAIIGFRAIGGWDWIVANWHPFEFEQPTREKMIEKSKGVADFSKISDEYEISRASNILGFRSVVAEHEATGQKLVVANENKTIKLSQDDFKNGKLEEKIKDINKKLNYQYIHVEDFKITSYCTLKTMGQNAPCAKFEANVTNLPVKNVKGMLAVAKDDNGKNKIIVSVNQGNKYSHIITEQFFKNVQLAEEDEEK